MTFGGNPFCCGNVTTQLLVQVLTEGISSEVKIVVALLKKKLSSAISKSGNISSSSQRNQGVQAKFNCYSSVCCFIPKHS
jgi:acetylornithine/succinyldiaminopimelate/putrescine aminotransferase